MQKSSIKTLVRACFTAMAGAALSLTATAQPTTEARERLLFNADWRFQKGDAADVGDSLNFDKIKDWLNATGTDLLGSKDAVKPAPPGSPGGDKIAYAQGGFDDSTWRKLNLPHDWAIEGPFKQELPGETGKLLFEGVGWYRKQFDIPATDKGRQLYLDIDGAMSYSAVWLNGKFVGGWPYGYSSYRLDLTPFINVGGKNTLAIRIDNPGESSRWYPGAGIYRNVWLVKTSAVHVAQWGTYVTTPTVTKESATVNLRVTIDNKSSVNGDVTLKTELKELDAAGNVGKAVMTLPSATLKLSAGQSQSAEISANVPNPKLWDVKSPNRYVAITTVESKGHIMDRYETRFGIRTIKFVAKEGFYLNGKLVELHGTCLHHDLGALGAAFNTRAMERRLEMLQAMGCNAIRCAHNPPASEFLELCDRMGFLVVDELTDTWTVPKKPKGYAVIFNDWSEKDLRAMVRRDRNHPSIILWSTGNEVREQYKKEGITISNRLTQITAEEDPTRLTTVGCDVPAAGSNGFQKTVGAFGYNYKPSLYKKFHEQNPDIPLYGSETASCISSRGEYAFPVTDDKSQGLLNNQMSSYGLYAPKWASTPDTEFKGQDENPYVAGEFVWTGFDYLGEPTPYNVDSTILTNFHDPAERAKAEQQLKELGKISIPSRSSYFGIIDLAGFPKDLYYLYQSRWLPDLPMAHILPHWNWADRVGEITPVHVYTSGDEAELFLNGKSLGRKSKGPLEYRLRWDDVKYEPGTLKVVAYKGGKPWAESIVKTTDSPTQLTLKPDRATLKADGTDLSFVTVTIADKDAAMVPRTNNLVRFEISGPAEIIAVDNGDATSHESFQAKESKAFNGLCSVVIRTLPGKTGTITLKATSDNLKSAETVLESK